MTLLFDDAKKLEKAVGAEAAEIIVRLFEERDEAKRKESVSKADLEIGLQTLKLELIKSSGELHVELIKTKRETLQWIAVFFVVQMIAVLVLMKVLA